MTGTRKVLRPSPRAYVTTIGAGLPIAAVLLVALGFGAAKLPFGLELYLLFVALSLGVLALYFRVVSVVVEPEAVRKRGILGVTRSWPREEVKGCALRSITFPGISRPVRLVVVYGVDHRALFAVSPQFWDAEFPNRLGSALGYPHLPKTFQDTTKADVQAEFPGVLPFVLRHNWLVGVGAALLILLLLVVYASTWGRLPR